MASLQTAISYRFYRTLSLLSSILCIVQSLSSSSVTRLSRSIVLPVASSESKTDDAVRLAFDAIVDSTDFFESSSKDQSSFTVPAFGKNVQVQLVPSSSSNEYALTITGTSSEEDVAWICTKFYECRDQLASLLDTSNLELIVNRHREKRTVLDPGVSAATAKLAGSRLIRDLLTGRIIDKLQTQGFVVVDTNVKTTAQQHEKLSEHLTEKSRQSDWIRTDKVNYLTREHAKACDMQDQFDLLMAIPSHLNDVLDFAPSQSEPLAPATRKAPLTIPERIQLAEYEHGAFYTAHKDNSYSSDTRDNYREYTCILYCNYDWTLVDGGALRLYPGSHNINQVADAVRECESVDIVPKNGRLLIFDSFFVHSVEKVTSADKVRRAFTLWVKRPY